MTKTYLLFTTTSLVLSTLLLGVGPTTAMDEDSYVEKGNLNRSNSQQNNNLILGEHHFSLGIMDERNGTQDLANFHYNEFFRLKQTLDFEKEITLEHYNNHSPYLPTSENVDNFIYYPRIHIFEDERSKEEWKEVRLKSSEGGSQIFLEEKFIDFSTLYQKREETLFRLNKKVEKNSEKIRRKIKERHFNPNFTKKSRKKVRAQVSKKYEEIAERTREKHNTFNQLFRDGSLSEETYKQLIKRTYYGEKKELEQEWKKRKGEEWNNSRSNPDRKWDKELYETRERSMSAINEEYMEALKKVFRKLTDEKLKHAISLQEKIEIERDVNEYYVGFILELEKRCKKVIQYFRKREVHNFREDVLVYEKKIKRIYEEYRDFLTTFQHLHVNE